MQGKPDPDQAEARFGIRLLSWLPALAFMAVIFWLSSMPGDELPMPDFRFGDKAIHFFAYGVLGFLIGQRYHWRGLLARTRAEPGGKSDAFRPFDLRGAAVGILYGIGDEIHQLHTPLRMFSLYDFVADALGILAGILVGNLMLKRRGG